MDWDVLMNQDWDADQKRYDDARDQERASRALAGIVGSILAQSGEIPLDPTSADFGEQAAMRQGRMGEQILQGIGSHPDIGYIPSNQIGSLTNSALNLQTKPLDFRMKEWEKHQDKLELKDKEAASRQALHDSRAADRMALEQERKTKIKELQMLRANGDITDEEYKQAVMMNFNLQPKAKDTAAKWQPWGEGQMMDTNPFSPTYKQIERVPVRPREGGGDKASNYVIQTDEQGNMLRVNKLTGDVEPLGVKGKGATATPEQQRMARKEIMSMAEDPNNFILTPDQRKKLVEGKTVDLVDTRIKPEALSEINAIATRNGLSAYHQPRVKYNITNWAGGDGGQEEGWGQVRPTQQPAPVQAQAPAQRPQVGQQQGYRTADDVKAAYNSGKISRDQAKMILQRKFGMK